MIKNLNLVVSGIMMSLACSSYSLAADIESMEDAAPLEEVLIHDPIQLSNYTENKAQVSITDKNDGSAASLYKTGLSFEEGKGGAVDYKKAESFYKQAMAKGSLDAVNALGVLSLGNGDYDQAKKYFMKAAAQNDEIAFFNLGNLSFLGNKAVPNKKALDFYTKSALKGYSPAYVALGDMYATGKGVSENIVEAEKFYLKAADLNDDVAIDRLALLYLLQDGTQVDADNTLNAVKTVELFQRVAAKGNAKAMYILSLLYQNGFYVQADNDKAVGYLKNAAELSYPDAEYAMAYLYLAGIYITKDYEKGVALMSKAAEHGNVDAQNNIGMLYLKGEIVGKDLSLAKSWLEKAASNGSAMANYNLAVVYDAGMGVQIDDLKAGRLYINSAKLGYIPSFLKLVEMYSTGSRGVIKNPEQAREWLDKAIELEDADAMLLKANAYFYGNYGYAVDKPKAKALLDKYKELGVPNTDKVEDRWLSSERLQKFKNVKK